MILKIIENWFNVYWGFCFIVFYDRYDINYIEESMSWSCFLYGMGGLYDLLSFGFLLIYGDFNKGLMMDFLFIFFGMLRKW